MNKNPSWLYENLDDCCDRYYGWDIAGCILRNAEATLVSGSIPKEADPTDGMYFPDWEGRTDTCITGGTAPPYMKKESALWMYESLADCCKAYYGWQEGFVKCIASGGGDEPTSSPITESWYINWDSFECVRSCEGAKPCGGMHQPWDTLHSTKAECCKKRMPWKVLGDCVKE